MSHITPELMRAVQEVRLEVLRDSFAAADRRRAARRAATLGNSPRRGATLRGLLARWVDRVRPLTSSRQAASWDD
jgi:hypothetical protein